MDKIIFLDNRDKQELQDQIISNTDAIEFTPNSVGVTVFKINLGNK